MISNYKIIISLFFLIFFSYFSKAEDWFFYDRLAVGSQPVAVILNTSSEFSQCYILCYGIDKNYNDIFEEGDEYPSLWRLNVRFMTGYLSFEDFTIHTEKIRDFPFGSIGIPFRPAVAGDTLYMCQNGIVSSYYLPTGNVIEDTIIRAKASAISKIGNKLFLSIRESLDTNYVLVYDIDNKSVRDSIPAYTMVQQTLSIGENLLAILCEGNWGSNDSKLIIANVEGKHEVLKTLMLGSGGNHVAFHNDLLAVTTGDNLVLVYSIHQDSINLVKTINLPTSGFDGVRESTFDGDSLIYTSSWDSHIYISDLNGSMPKFIDAKGKAEGFAIAEFFNTYKVLVITNQFITNSYQPDNNITIYSNFPISSVNNKKKENNFRLYPNPIQEIAYLEFNSNINEDFNQAEIYSLIGEYLGSAEVSNLYNTNILQLNLSKLNLQRGIYNLKLIGFNGTKGILFVKE